MVKRHAVEGYEKFCELIKELEVDKIDIFVLFSGSKNEKGESWCPDCVTADPVIEEGLNEAIENSHFVYCGVGSRDVWKDPNSPFRKDPRMRIKSVPTLMGWGRAERLEELECADSELVKMILQPE